MANNKIIEGLKILSQAILNFNNDLKFNLMEIGALPIDSVVEPFHNIVELFPGSSILAFEVDKELCDRLNSNAKSGFKYYPIALGKDQKDNDFYITNHPMCCSLYKPNNEFLSKYNNLEVAHLKEIEKLDTQSLDTFIKGNNINYIDFIKIDIQGAELDVFKNGLKTLKNVLSIVTEVEFVPLYEDQPLFGDVTKFLSEHGFMFHKFITLSGRSLKPIIMNNNINTGSQHLWADVLYIKDLLTLSDLNSEKLLKTAIFAYIYGSIDLVFYCFNIHDEKFNTEFKKLINDIALNK